MEHNAETQDSLANSQTIARFIVVVIIIIARIDLDFRKGRKEATGSESGTIEVPRVECYVR